MKLSAKVFLSFLILALATLGAAREFTSKDGRKINADVVAVTDTEAVIKMGNRQFTVPVTDLSPGDQAFLKEWKTKQLKDLIPKLDVSLNTGKSDRSDRSDGFDDRLGSFQFSIKIENDEQRYELKGGKAELSVLGESCENDDRFAVMQKNTFQVDLEDGGVFEWTGDEVAYRFDNRPPAYWGYEYYGYVFRLKNANGKVIYTKISPSKFEGGAEEILKMKNGSAFDPDFKVRGQARIYNR